MKQPAGPADRSRAVPASHQSWVAPGEGFHCRGVIHTDFAAGAGTAAGAGAAGSAVPASTCARDGSSLRRGRPNGNSKIPSTTMPINALVISNLLRWREGKAATIHRVAVEMA